MSVRVQLDHRQSSTYTNLDYVTGRAILTLPTDATISAITVKLEAESRTRLAGPKSPTDQDRKKTLLEVHKLLYKVQRVFPGPELGDSRNAQFTLQRGQYEYPFSIKIPFNNDCVNNTSLIKDLKLGQVAVSVGEEPQHTKLTLPPTLGGYPGEAEIKYYVKATVVRPKFYQENLRSTHDLTFLPIEPPRPETRNEETYARRRHQFQAYSGQLPRRKSLFKKETPASDEKEEPLLVSCDARLPNPPIVTSREPLPLRILVERLNNSSAVIYLTTLQIELIGRTNVRAYDLNRTENDNFVVCSLANLSVSLEPPKEKETYWTVPSRFWDNVPLPNSIPPSFKTCNISRNYELEVRVGLSHGMGDGIRPEIIILPLRLNVEVYSGIRPPKQLLAAMAEAQQRPSRIHEHNTSNQHNHHTFPHRPTSSNVNPPDADDDLPPSYEDAIADEIGPVDGPRREYHQPQSESDQAFEKPAFNPDQKSSAGLSGLGRRVSERLFSQNAPRPPGSGRTSSNPWSGSSYSNQVDPMIEEDMGNMTINSPQDRRRSAGGHGRQTSGGYVHSQDVMEEAEYRPALPVRKPSAGMSSTPVSPIDEKRRKE